MATFIKRNEKMPLWIKVFWFVIFSFFAFLVIYPATQNAVINTKTMRIEIPKNR